MDARYPIPTGKRNFEDILVYATKKMENQATCKKWRAVYDGNGHLRIDRKPAGKPPVVEAFGIKWLVLIEGRYLLTGEELGKQFPWVIGQNRVSALAGASPVQIGFFTIPPDWTDDDYQVIEHLQYVDGHEDEDTTNEAHTNWVTSARRTQMRQDYKALVIVPAPKGGKITVSRMCDLPGFSIYCGDPAKFPNTTKLTETDIPNYDEVVKRTELSSSDCDDFSPSKLRAERKDMQAKRKQSIREGKRPERRIKRERSPEDDDPGETPTQTKTIKKPKTPKSKDSTAKDTPQSKETGTFVERMRRYKRKEIVDWELQLEDVKDGLMREVYRNFDNPDNDKMMRTLAKLTIVRNDLIEELERDGDRTKVLPLVTQFKELTKEAEELIETRVHRNRRGCVINHDYLVSLQIAGIDTGDHLAFHAKNFVARNHESFLRQYISNTPSDVVVERLDEILRAQESISEEAVSEEAVSESTEQDK